MAKIGGYSRQKVSNTTTLNKRVVDSLKIVSSSEPSCSQWPDRSDFVSTTSCQTTSNSYTNGSDCRQSKTSTEHRYKICSKKWKKSPNKSKSKSKRSQSRFVTHLNVELFQPKKDNICGNNSNDDSFNDGMDYQISESSSPFKQSIDSNSSPIGSKNNRKTCERKESIGLMIKKCLANFLDDSIQCLEKNIKFNAKKSDTSLRLQALNVLKKMKTSRLEFSQRKSLPQRVDSSHLTLKVIEIETEFGFCFLRSVVLSDDFDEFKVNSSLILILKHEMISGLDLTSKYIIKVFRRFTRMIINQKLYIFNAFNIEIIENNSNLVEDRNQDSNYEIIWQNDSIN